MKAPSEALRSSLEDMPLEPNEAALFDMMLEEAVPPALTTTIVARLLDRRSG